MLKFLEPTGEVYDGQFGTFTVDKSDRVGVVIYRGSLACAAIAWVIGTAIALSGSLSVSTMSHLDICYWVFYLALGVGLWTIHIYLAPLHKALQALWLVGGLGSLWVAFQAQGPLVARLYADPLSLALSGWIFIALTGLFVKEAFCFNRAETKVLTVVVPIVLGGHWLGLLSLGAEKVGLVLWTALMLVFAIRKCLQPIPPDLGDKSVFEYLHKNKIKDAFL
jgi:uncharacterized integral membrane protein